MQFTDWSVQSVNCHIALKAMFYFLTKTQVRDFAKQWAFKLLSMVL